jgi:penicillin amidase
VNRSRTLRTVLVAAVAAVVVLALGLTAVVATFATGARPQTSGTITVAGMGDTVTVRRDASGVPHLSGRSLTDLARAQGFVHAQDRFFDMDLRRHIATGTLSELVGEQGLPADRVVRTMGWRQVAEQSLPLPTGSTPTSTRAPRTVSPSSTRSSGSRPPATRFGTGHRSTASRG